MAEKNKNNKYRDELKNMARKIWEQNICPFLGTCLKIPEKSYSCIKRLVKRYYKNNPDKASIRRKKNKQIFRKIIFYKKNFIAREKSAADSMAKVIVRMDHKTEEFIKRMLNFLRISNLKILFAREYAELNKAKLLKFLAFGLVMAIIVASSVSYVTAYEYSYNGRVLGVVKNQEEVLKLLDIVTAQLSKEYKAEVKIDKELDIAFNRVISINRDLDLSEDVLNRLTYMQDMKARGYGIYVDGTREVIVSSQEKADEVLESVKTTYLNTSGGSEYEKVGFAEKVEIRKVDTKLGRIQNSTDALSKIMTGAIASKVHVVESGDTFSGIAKKYGIDSGLLNQSNPGITPERLSIGQEIVLTQSVPLITVQTVEVATYIEPIGFETTFQNSSSMYSGEQSTRVRGVIGERQVVARIIKNNGIEVAKTELKSDVIKEPTTEIILVGIKPPPPLQGTGTFIYPVTGARLTSKYSRYHQAIDLAIGTGTKIRAADGGTVISAGYSGSYGYVVRVNHGGNKVTLYAHCSKIFVKAGEKVYQGQHIANVGNTGRSTGPHVHFEIMVNGAKKNPLNYL